MRRLGQKLHAAEAVLDRIRLEIVRKLLGEAGDEIDLQRRVLNETLGTRAADDEDGDEGGEAHHRDDGADHQHRDAQAQRVHRGASIVSTRVDS